MTFTCPICGAVAYYYGDDVAICSSGARLTLPDIPPLMIYTRLRRMSISQSLFPNGISFSLSTPDNPINTPNWNIMYQIYKEKS